MSNDSKILIAIALAAGIFYGGYRAGCSNSCKCGETQQQQGHTQSGLKPIQVPK